MNTYFFWDIENVSFHNLDYIMNFVNAEKGTAICYIVYARMKQAHKEVLIKKNWKLCEADSISKNSADKIIIQMIENLLSQDMDSLKKIFLISEDKGFKFISRKIIAKGVDLEIICATKRPPWMQKLENYTVKIHLRKDS